MRAGLLPTLLLLGSAAAQTIPASVCEVTRSPVSFDGKMVRIRATIVYGFEIFGISDPHEKCGLIWLTYPGGAPVASVSIGSRVSDTKRVPVKLRNDGQLRRFQKLLYAEMYSRDRGSSCVGCNRYEVTATLGGRIDYAGKTGGFGHMNGYALQLVLESVSGVEAIDLATKYDPAEYSTDPIRFPTGYLRGRVFAPNGRPVAHVAVKATSVTEVPLHMQGITEWTDDNGNFKIDVPPGTYVIGINLGPPPSPSVPFSPTYYPGVADANAATKLTVADRQNLNGLVIRIPERLSERKIPVKVVWPDGTPVKDANVWLTEMRNPYWVVGGPVSHTVSDGTFDLIGFEDVDYSVHANIYVKPLYKPYCAETKTLKAEESVPDRIVMILSRTGEGCRRPN